VAHRFADALVDDRALRRPGPQRRHNAQGIGGLVVPLHDALAPGLAGRDAQACGTVRESIRKYGAARTRGRQKTSLPLHRRMSFPHVQARNPHFLMLSW